MISYNDSRFRNNKGQALIQVIIAMGIFAFLIVSFMNAVSSQRKDIKFNQAMIARNLLEMRMEKYLGSSGSLTFTRNSTASLGNVKFAGCYTAGAALCEATTTPVGFILYDPNGVAVSGASVNSPVRYTSRGEICNPGNNDCVFDVYTTFTAICPGGTATCASPINLSATFTISQTPGVTAFGGFTFKTVTSAPFPVGAPPYLLSYQIRSYAGGSSAFNIGVHDFCALARYDYDGDGAGSCLVNGTKKSPWTLTIVDEGDANPLVCGAICLDFY
ncbi:hypothetical protein [Bdellovibrio sp. HCB337]|uniref:hypothetical protein n=1 Tax=Bdellovibrio sp. HCB337 TaxID=3394358 RepID=UPI0039A6E74A